MAINFTIPTEPADRRKFFIAVGIISICAIWLGYLVLSNVRFGPPAKPLDSPGWRIAKEISSKLNADKDFADVSLGVVSENPLKLSVVGAVFKKADLDRLPDLLKEANPNAEFDIQVELLKK